MLHRAVALLLVVTPALTIGATEACAAPPPVGVDPRILIVGDSVILGARDAVTERLDAWQVTFVAEESLSTLGAVGLVQANRAAAGSIAVVELGNNDGATPSILSARVDQVMAAFAGVQRVIWVNLRTFADWVPAANAVLADATVRWPNLEIADWNAVATPRPDLVAGDGIHLGGAGAAAMAELVGNHVDRAASALIAPPPTVAARVERAPVVVKTRAVTARGPAEAEPGHGVALDYWLMFAAITGALICARPSRARRERSSAPAGA